MGGALGASFVASSAVGCLGEVEIDPEERAPSLPGAAPPVVEFDPAASIVPFPNALLVSPETGRLTLPPSCGETPGSSAERLRESLNQLDGFGTSKLELTATVSEPVDAASLEGRVFLVRVAERGAPLSTPEPVPVDVAPGTSLRASASCQTSSAVPNITVRPRAPLAGSSTYAVLIARGVATEAGEALEPSSTWALVRQPEAPVSFGDGPVGFPVYNSTPLDPSDPEELAALVGLDRLWRAHAPLLQAFDAAAPAFGPTLASRGDLLLAWAFDTQTITDPIDPTLAGSAANALVGDPGALEMGEPLAGEGAPLSVEAFYASALPGVPCELIGCEAIGAIYAASEVSEAPLFTSTSFLAGDDCAGPATLAGSFDDPIAPSPVCERSLPLVVVVPLAAPPPAGYPTVLFAHGLGRSKEDLLAIAGNLARAGIASVALDAVDHGVRAAQVSTEAELGCDGPGEGRPCEDVLAPSCAPQCFAPILSADLARTRDHLRQTVLDQLKLTAALRGCADVDACGALQVDPARVGYLGQSLGALIGGVTVAVSDMPAAVLNAGGADWLQFLTDTQTDRIRCPLVDSLIEAGVVAGETWDAGANPNAACLGEAWKTEPGFLQFAAAARWLLDPVDPVNFARPQAAAPERSVLVAEVVGDPVMPNSVTATLATALGLEPQPAAVATALPPEPSPPALAPGSHWLRYEPSPADAESMFPGNAYQHGSLLAPAAPGPDQAEGSGELGTLLMQADTIGYLLTHLGGTP